jgi:hypothetical protein
VSGAMGPETDGAALGTDEEKHRASALASPGHHGISQILLLTCYISEGYTALSSDLHCCPSMSELCLPCAFGATPLLAARSPPGRCDLTPMHRLPIWAIGAVR